VEAILPGSRFVHVVRDGRGGGQLWFADGVVAGASGAGGVALRAAARALRGGVEASGRSFVLLAGLAWKILSTPSRQPATTLAPEQWLEVRYEDVLAEPRDTFAAILDFLGLPGDRRFERALARYDFRPGRTDAFRGTLDPDKPPAPRRLARRAPRQLRHAERPGSRIV